MNGLVVAYSFEYVDELRSDAELFGSKRVTKYLIYKMNDFNIVYLALQKVSSGWINIR